MPVLDVVSKGDNVKCGIESSEKPLNRLAEGDPFKPTMLVFVEVSAWLMNGQGNALTDGEGHDSLDPQTVAEGLDPSQQHRAPTASAKEQLQYACSWLCQPTYSQRNRSLRLHLLPRQRTNVDSSCMLYVVDG